MSIHVSIPFNPARLWTDDDFGQLKRLAGLGLSSGEIGVQMGRTKAAIEGMCRRRRIRLSGGTTQSPAAREMDRQRAAALRARLDARRAAMEEQQAIPMIHLAPVRWPGATPP